MYTLGQHSGHKDAIARRQAAAAATAAATVSLAGMATAQGDMLVVLVKLREVGRCRFTAS
jgi:hypothetical protein